jgi:nitrous oxidase accessory protein NosD
MSVRSPLAGLFAVAALLAAAPAVSAATLVVDAGTSECPNAAFDTVRDAVAAAATAGDTIAICPGVYREAGGVEIIGKSLTLRGAGADRVRIEPTADLRDPAPPGGIYEPRDDEGNVIAVNSPSGPVHISGVTVAGGDASDPRGAEAGIVFHNTSGSVSRSRVADIVPADTADYSANVGYGVVAFGDAAGDYAVTLSRMLVERYGKGGVLVTNPGGTSVTGTVEDSIIRGNGPRSEPGQGQNGIQVSRAGARATIRRNTIADHRFLADESASVGVLLFDVDPAGTTITDNDFRGNGYGVFNAGPDLCDASVAVTATSNYWGDPLGPTVDPSSGPLVCPPATYAPTGDPLVGDRVNGAAVNFTGFDTVPHGAPVAPGLQPDAPPSVQITAPADGTAATPGSAVTVTAAATDDFDLSRVDFLRNGTVVESDTDGPPYAAGVTAPAAGGTAAVTVVAYDSANQSASDSIALRGTAAVTTPRAPAPEDRPPRVAFTSPGSGTAIDPRAVPRLTANASDDNGVASVAFLDDGRIVCVDNAAPFDCAYQPTGDDVGRNTLIAVARDRAGQTAVDFRAIRLGKFTPLGITARTTPRRDRRRPYRYRTTGRLTLPAGVTPAQACANGGTVQVQFAAGRLRLPLIGTLRPDCSFRASIVFPSRRPLGRRGRLTITTLFTGNDVLAPARAKKQRVRAG